MNPEQALMYQLQKEQESSPSMGDAALMGAMGGAGIGIVGGQVPHWLGKKGRDLQVGWAMGANNQKDIVKAQRFMDTLKGREIRPGFRFAGGLVGAILGGALGAGMQQAAMQESPTARMLAKLQTGGPMDEMDKMELQNMLAGVYSNMG